MNGEVKDEQSMKVGEREKREERRKNEKGTKDE